MREVSLLNEGEFKGFFDREMHALLWLSLRSLPLSSRCPFPLLFQQLPSLVFSLLSQQENYCRATAFALESPYRHWAVACLVEGSLWSSHF